MLGQHIVNGVTLGALYALIATGYSLVFSMVGMINLAFGAVLTVGSLVGYQYAVEMGWGHLAGFVVAMAICGLLGLATDAVAVQPIRRQRLPIYFALLSTYGFNVLVQSLSENVTLKAWATEFRPFPPPFAVQVYQAWGVRFSNMDVLIVVMVLVAMAMLHWYMKHTWGGKAVRMTASRPEVAEIMGVNTRRVIAYAFAASGVLAALAGMMLGMYYGTVSAGLGAAPGTKGFIAVLIGGRGQISGAVLGAVILGLLESLAAGVIGSGYRDLVAFTVLVLFLLLKPSGLLGGSASA